MALTNKEVLQLADALIKRWAELTREELERDIARFDSLDNFDQFYLRGYWMRQNELLLKIHKIHLRTENLEDQIRLIEEEFGEQLGIPSTELKVDVKARLDSLKRRVAKEFELEIKSITDLRVVTSPIEQIFLMEWKFSHLEERHDVVSEPQGKVRTQQGEYVVDFLVRHRSIGKSTTDFVIELDGYEFHERTPQQATRDRRRERAIIRSGMTVLRFSGHEIVKDARGCSREVEEYLAKGTKPDNQLSV